MFQIYLWLWTAEASGKPAESNGKSTCCFSVEKCSLIRSCDEFGLFRTGSNQFVCSWTANIRFLQFRISHEIFAINMIAPEIISLQQRNIKSECSDCKLKINLRFKLWETMKNSHEILASHKYEYVIASHFGIFFISLWWFKVCRCSVSLFVA